MENRVHCAFSSSDFLLLLLLSLFIFFFSNAFLTAAGLVQFMVERWSIEREFVGSTLGVGPNLSTMFTKAIRFPTSFPAHLVCRLVLKTTELRRNAPGN